MKSNYERASKTYQKHQLFTKYLHILPFLRKTWGVDLVPILKAQKPRTSVSMTRQSQGPQLYLRSPCWILPNKSSKFPTAITTIGRATSLIELQSPSLSRHTNRTLTWNCYPGPRLGPGRASPKLGRTFTTRLYLARSWAEVTNNFDVSRILIGYCESRDFARWRKNRFHWAMKVTQYS